MATKTLTLRGVAALKTTKVQEDVYDALVPGFGVRVSATGMRTYFVRYRANGAQRRMSLGRHPVLSLADARNKAKEKLTAAQAGEDPALERQARRSKDATFGALADEVLEAKAATTRGTTRIERRRIVDVELADWKVRPAASITRREVVHLLERIASRGSPIMANRTLEVIRLVYNGGIRRGFPTVEANPAHLVGKVAAEGARDRYLERDEIKKFWRTLDGESPTTAAVFRMALLTAQRIGNVMSMRWADVDASDVWRIPAESFKGARSHIVPLSAEVRAVLDTMQPISGEAKDGEDPPVYVFPGRGDGKVLHMRGHNAALRRIRERSGLPHFTVHDLRRTLRTHATRMEEPKDKRDPAGLGVAPHVADAVLGHKEVSLGFARYTGEVERYLLAEKREALERWGAFVRAAITAR